jgi:hypothetical protein
MNPWQMVQQIKHKLQTVVWPSGAGDEVFGTSGVFATSGTPSSEQIPGAFPSALVTLGGGLPDVDDPDLIVQSISVTAMVSVVGDSMGENAILGSSVADLGKSAGKGLSEVSERVRFALQDLTSADGAKILLTGTDIGSPSALGNAHFVYEDFRLTALCTSQLSYAAPQQIAHDSGTWSWEGTHCSNRFDFKQYRLVRKSGSTPSTSPSDGVLLYTGEDAAAVRGSSSGNAYTVFADYSSRKQSGVIEDSSPVDVGSYKVVS